MSCMHKHTHTCTNAQARYLAEPLSGKAVQASGFGRIHFIILYLSPMVMPSGRWKMGGFAFSMQPYKQKELRSAGQRFLRSKPQPWCSENFLISTSKSSKVEPLVQLTQVPSHKWTTASPL